MQPACGNTVAVADLQAPVMSAVSVAIRCTVIAARATVASGFASTFPSSGTSTPVCRPPSPRVAVTYDVADDCDAPAAMSCALAVVSNEPVDGLGDGDTAPDWEILDSHHVRLRPERAGSGTGRIYTISVTCGDSRGHSSTRAMDVVVPKSQK
jgi:hypothetical protein